jgi:hypothetical protein
MQKLFADTDVPLPATLQDDLEELLTWDNNCFLSWVSVSTEQDPDGTRWFRVKLSSDGSCVWLRLEFWIPEWMTERGAAAILPAHLSLDGCRPGVEAAVDLPPLRWSELRGTLPRVARTCARLINELWGRTDTEDVLLLTIDYQEHRLETPFSSLPGYGQ